MSIANENRRGFINTLGWTTLPLKEVISVKSGQGLSAKEMKKGNHIVYGGNGKNGMHNDFTHKEPCLIIGRVGALCGRVYITEPYSWITDNALFISKYLSNSNIIYLYFLLNHLDLNKHANKNAQPLISGGILYSIQVLLPPLPEQKKIAEILSTWDDAISNTEQLIEKLKLRKKGLMQELLTGKTRLKGFSGKWKAMKIGEIAEHYSEKNKLNEKIEVLSCTKYDGLVRSLDYFGRKVYGNDLSKYKIVPNGFFAYATNHIEEGSIGIQDKLDKGLVSPMYSVFKPNKNVDSIFLFKLLKTEKMIFEYQSNMSGSIARRGGLRWNVFETIQIQIPELIEQKAIAEILTTVDEEIKVYEKYLSQLQSQKKGLMQKLLTGEVRVNVDEEK